MNGQRRSDDKSQLTQACPIIFYDQTVHDHRTVWSNHGHPSFRQTIMPNEYSVEIHHYITEQITIHEQKALSSHDRASETKRSYSRGALEELTRLRSYLAEKVDLKDYTYY